jgi:hypothetical protein
MPLYDAFFSLKFVSLVLDGYRLHCVLFSVSSSNFHTLLSFLRTSVFMLTNKIELIRDTGSFHSYVPTIIMALILC